MANTVEFDPEKEIAAARSTMAAILQCLNERRRETPTSKVSDVCALAQLLGILTRVSGLSQSSLEKLLDLSFCIYLRSPTIEDILAKDQPEGHA